jgi:hypothetical protein
LGRKLDYRAIVERHFGKHTGLQHSAKACLDGVSLLEAGQAAGGGEARNNQIFSPPEETGRRRISRRF